MDELDLALEQKVELPLERPVSRPASDGPSFRVWLREGGRMLGLRAPRWERLDAGPGVVAMLVLVGYLLACAIQRAFHEGSPGFYWQAVLGGWSASVLFLWLAWLVARSGSASPGPAPSAATLFALSAGAGLVLSLLYGAVALGLQAVYGKTGDWTESSRWLLWGVPVVWAGLAHIVVLLRVAGNAAARVAILLVMPLVLALNSWLAPVVFWWPEPTREPDSETYRGLKLNEEVLGAQPQLLADALQGLRAPTPDRVNLYGLTYAPYATQDVFLRESAAVSKTMRERFGAEGRMVELVLNPATSLSLPWATPHNLRKSIARMASLMDRERDVLFLHLSSHGGADATLATSSWPLETEAMTPLKLKQWLDEAGVRWRVISISACFSGSWIDGLANENTLVMTAADATHTSYGCGTKSELTFFGRAMYVDALQSTWSFEEAHAQARQLIEAREREAGKTDGYSNPQWREGAAIRPVLQRLQAERQR